MEWNFTSGDNSRNQQYLNNTISIPKNYCVVQVLFLSPVYCSIKTLLWTNLKFVWVSYFKWDPTDSTVFKIIESRTVYSTYLYLGSLWTRLIFDYSQMHSLCHKHWNYKSRDLKKFVSVLNVWKCIKFIIKLQYRDR